MPVSRVRESGAYPATLTVNSFGRLPASTTLAVPDASVSHRPPGGVAGGEIGGPRTSRGGMKTLPPVHRTRAWGIGRPDEASRTSTRAGSGADGGKHPCSMLTQPINPSVSPQTLIDFTARTLHGSVVGLAQGRQRWGRDSNPRYAEAYTGFQDRRIQPLCHPTLGRPSYSAASHRSGMLQANPGEGVLRCMHT